MVPLHSSLVTQLDSVSRKKKRNKIELGLDEVKVEGNRLILCVNRSYKTEKRNNRKNTGVGAMGHLHVGNSKTT